MASKRIQGITIEIGGDATKLTKALQDVERNIKNSKSSLTDVNKLLKMDPTNTELLAQKQKYLTEAIDGTKEKLKQEKEALEQLAAKEQTTETVKQQEALKREIEATTQELKGLENEYKQFGSVSSQQLQIAGEKMQEVGRGMTQAGQTLTKTVTAPIVGLGALAVAKATEFDSAMAKVQAISGASVEELEQLREKAIDVGNKTKYSATEIAEGFSYMAMAGWKTTDMLQGIEGIASLAAASGEDLATTSDIVTDALTAFGMQAKDSARFADVLAAASSNANTNVAMMGETFKYAAPLAGTFGFSVEDTALAIGLMANSGIKASTAGTSLRRLFTELGSDLEIYDNGVKTATIQTTNADGSMRDLRDILVDLRAAFAGLSDAEKKSNAKAIVGQNAIGGFLAMMNASASDFDKLSGAVDSSAGAAENMADIMNDNLGGQLTILKGQLETLAISFGETMVPILQDLVGSLQEIVSWLNGFDDETKESIVKMAAFAAAVGPVLIGIGSLINAIGTIVTTIGKFKAAIASGAIVSKLGAMWGGISSAAASAAGVIQGVGAAIAGAFEGIAAALGVTVGVLGAAFVAVGAAIAVWVKNWDEIKEAAGLFVERTIEHFGELKEWFTGVWASISTVLSEAWASIQETITEHLGYIKEIFLAIWGEIRDFFQPIVDAIKYTLDAAWAYIVEKTTEKFNEIYNIAFSVWTFIQTAVSLIVDTIKEKITLAWQEILNFLTPILDAIRLKAEEVWNAIKEVVSTVTEAIKGAVEVAFTFIETHIFSKMLAIQEKITEAWERIKADMTEKAQAAVDKVKEIFEGLGNFFKGLIDKAKTWGHDLIEGFKAGIVEKRDSVAGAIRGVGDTIRANMGHSHPTEGPMADDYKWMPDMMQLFVKGITENAPSVVSAMQGVTGAITGQMESIDYTPQLSSIGQSVGALAAAGAGNITIPVYIGQQKFAQAVVNAGQSNNYRSGGR